MEQEQSAIKVFISYSWDSAEHKNWVLELARKLRFHGVDAKLDVWDARLGSSLSRFMEEGLSKSDIVLCICSNNYVERANDEERGVGFEKRIISSDMLSGVFKDSVIPIIKNNSSTCKVPNFLKSIKYLDFDQEGDTIAYRKLIERIYNEDIKMKPALGHSPFEVTSISNKITNDLSIQKVNYYNSNKNGVVKFDYKKNDGRFVIGSGDYMFDTMWSECGPHSVYCYKDYIQRIGYKSECYNFPSVEQLIQFDFSSRARSLSEGEVIILENKNGKFAAVKVLSVSKNQFDIDHVLEFEFKIYDI